MEGIDDREAAALLTNEDIGLERELLPPLPSADEYYWCDLVGLRALDADGEPLGEVASLFRTGAHDILRVRGEDGREILTPFVDAHVLKVDIAGGCDSFALAAGVVSDAV